MIISSYFISGGPEFEAIGLDSTTKVLFVPAKLQSKLYPKVYPPPDIPRNFDPFRRLKLREGKKRIDNMNLSQKVIFFLSVTPVKNLKNKWKTSFN